MARSKHRKPSKRTVGEVVVGVGLVGAGLLIGRTALAPEKTQTVDEALKASAAAVQMHCGEVAVKAVNAQFPTDVKNDPSTPADETYDAGKARLDQGAAVNKQQFDACVQTNWTVKVDGITFAPTPLDLSPTATTTVPASTTSSTNG